MTHESSILSEALSAAWNQMGRACLLEGDGEEAMAVADRLAKERGGVAAAAWCDYEADGPFAGVAGLLHALAARAERAGLADLVAAHAGSLAILAPSLAQRYSNGRLNLSVSAPTAEALRNFTNEWAVRHVNGVIDFLFALQDQLGGPFFCLGLVDLDRAGPLASDLLYHAARRGARRPLLLWASAEGPGRPQRPRRPATGPEEAQLGERITRAVHAGQVAESCRLLEAASTYCSRRGFATDAVRFAERWVELLASEGAPTDRVPALLQLASVLLPVGEYARAEAAVQEALTCPLTPRRRASCLYTLALLHTRFLVHRDLDLAMRYVNEAIAALGDRPAADALAFYENGRALVLLRQGRVQEAGEVCRTVLVKLAAQTEPDRHRLQKAILLDNVARVHAAQGEWEAAAAYFTEALRYDPNYTELYQERGTAYQRLGRYGEALADFEQGIACGPPSAQLAASRANVWMATGEPQRGVADFTRALELDDGLVYALKGRALCYYDLGRPAEALADYDAYLQRRPEDDEALTNRGSLRHDRGDLAGALADLNAALRINPANVAALANRAAVRVDAGEPGSALRDLTQAVALDPENPVLTENLALLELGLA